MATADCDGSQAPSGAPLRDSAAQALFTTHDSPVPVSCRESSPTMRWALGLALASSDAVTAPCTWSCRLAQKVASKHEPISWGIKNREDELVLNVVGDALPNESLHGAVATSAPEAASWRKGWRGAE